MQGVIEALVCTAVEPVYKCFHTTPFKCFVYRLVQWEQQWKILLLEKKDFIWSQSSEPFSSSTEKVGFCIIFLALHWPKKSFLRKSPISHPGSLRKQQNRDGWLPSPNIDSLFGTFAARREHYRFLVMSGITLCWVALDTWADIFLGYLFGCSFSEHLDAID